MQFFDQYILFARVAPIVIVALPLGFLCLAVLPGYPLLVTAFFGLVAAGGTAIVAQVGRGQGSKKQPGLWKSWDGPPTTRLLRHRHTSGDIALVPGLRQQIATWVEDSLPTEQEEAADSELADAKYEEVTNALKEATRDKTKFPLVFAENTTYGFRRNLWGLKTMGLPIAATLAVILWGLLIATVWGRPWPEPWWDIFANPDGIAAIRTAIAIADTALVAVWIFLVKPSWVKAAAEVYAQRLMESVRALRSR